nr:MAG TPA: hypothetical protein [Caudoviricetes sp.]
MRIRTKIWTPVADMMLTALCLSGTPACDIARALNRPEKECRRRAKELGTAMPPKTKPYSPSFAADGDGILPEKEDLMEAMWTGSRRGGYDVDA